MTTSPSSGPPEGRELDAMIAEKVMGFEWVKVSPHPDDEPPPIIYRYLSPPGFRDGFASWHHFPIVLAAGNEPAGQPVSSQVPDYSTDIAAAWLMVEKLRADGFDFWFRHVAYCTAEFTKGERSFSADNDSAPRAICLAALAASVPTGEEPK